MWLLLAATMLTAPVAWADDDRDRDGWDEDEDCDDRDPYVHPHAEELCNGIDDDCDGDVDPGCDSGAPDTGQNGTSSSTSTGSGGSSTDSGGTTDPWTSASTDLGGTSTESDPPAEPSDPAGSDGETEAPDPGRAAGVEVHRAEPAATAGCACAQGRPTGPSRPGGAWILGCGLVWRLRRIRIGR
jgi:hypothetical protein